MVSCPLQAAQAEADPNPNPLQAAQAEADAVSEMTSSLGATEAAADQGADADAAAAASEGAAPVQSAQEGAGVASAEEGATETGEAVAAEGEAAGGSTAVAAASGTGLHTGPGGAIVHQYDVWRQRHSLGELALGRFCPWTVVKRDSLLLFGTPVWLY